MRISRWRRPRGNGEWTPVRVKERVNEDKEAGHGPYRSDQGSFAQFRADDRPGPIHMLNLVRRRPQAAYPDGRKATGAEAYAAYGRESGPVFERLGGRIVGRDGSN